MVTEASKLATAAKKKYYEFEYQYTRYNPQLGSYTATSTVIASTEKEAEKFAKMSCDKAIYGHNSFDCVIGHGPLLTRDVDYELTITYKKDRYGHSIGSPIVLPKKIYHY